VLATGTTIGSYRVLAQIGEGGMGTVYLGEHALLGRRAAIKVLLPQLSINADIVKHFFNEVVHHKAIAASERSDEAGVIRAVAHRQGGELQAGDPALGAGFERRHRLSRQGQTHHIGEERGGFRGA